MRYCIIVLVFIASVYNLQASGVVVQETQDGIIKVQDNSGMSEEELRKKAEKLDTKTKQKQSWESLSPKADRYDWVQTKSGEWFKGKIIGLYNDHLEFDSKEVGDYTFKMKDVQQIKSHSLMSVNIENRAVFSGILRYKDNTVTVIQGKHAYDFNIDDVVSIAPEGNREVDYWSGKITLSMDTRKGNTDQSDFAFDGKVIRRTADSILELKYLGRVSTREGELTANNQRFNQKYDLYQTRYFFWTPLVTEYYSDQFRNIKDQLTVGAGAGYTFFKKGDDELKLSVGPSVIYTQFESTNTAGQKSHTTGALEVSSELSFGINTMTDLKYNYKFTLSDKITGRYKHHMVTTLENEITSWLDFDVSLIWDYLHVPQPKEDGLIPKKNDVQLLVGIGIEF